MGTRALLLASGTFLLGLLMGWWLAQAPLEPSQSTPTPVTVNTPTPRPVVPAKRQAATVWLTIEYDQNSRLVAATRIANSGVLVASLPAIYPARAVYYTREGGDASPIFPRVVAADGVSRLIAFEDSAHIDPSINDMASDGYVLSRESGSLYLGREVQLRWPQSSTALSVASPVKEDRRGHTFFDVMVPSTHDDRGGPLLDDNGVLIGLLLNNIHREDALSRRRQASSQQTPTAAAIDASTLRAFIDGPRFDKPLDLRQFSQFWATTSYGLTSDALQLAQAKRWINAYNNLQRVWDSTGNLNLFQQDLFVHSAYQATLQMIDNNEPWAALNVLDDMQTNHPESEPWCHSRVRALEASQQYRQTVQAVRRCLVMPAVHTHDSIGLGVQTDSKRRKQSAARKLYESATRAALAYAEDNNAPRDERYQTLLDALSAQPNAKLYRALGDLDYVAQRYARAREYYRQAVALDSGLLAELGPRLRNSEQRATTAPAAEVPFEKNRGGIVIDLTLNNSGQSFRFLVDTGATYTALSTGTLLRLGLNDIFTRGAPLIELQSANGPIYVQRFTLDAITVGDATINNVPVVVLEDFGRYDGLLGLSFLRHFDVSLDQQAGKLILTRR